MKECILYKHEKPDKSGKVRCLACAHKCLINKSKFGICGVRKNINGKLMLLVYGKIAAMHIDPIEKKPLYYFLPGTKTFSIGTVGCNFMCSNCQNYDISQINKGNENMILGDDYTKEQIIREAIKTGCKSIAYTYNEPIIFAEFVKDCAELAKKKGLKNIMVTNGYWTKESFDFLKDFIDAVNIDLKGNDDFYKKVCGSRLQPVLDTIKRCHKHGIHIEITTLLIPDENDDEIILNKIAKFISSLDNNIPWHISRFFPMHKMKNKDITSKESLEKAYKIGKKYLNNVYLGNV